MTTDRSAGADLVPVHGGLDEPVNQVVPLGQRKRFLAEAEGLPSIRVSLADVSTVYRLGDGTLSPLTGPMREDDWHRVLDERVVLSRGRRYAWGIPLSLPVGEEEARGLARSGSAAIRDEQGNLVAVVDDLEIFDWDKQKYVKSVYRTERFDHPGGREVQNDERSRLVGGSIRTLPQQPHPEYSEFMLSPRMTRALIRDRQWEHALAFQTRNPLHRAHEYALVVGAERLTAQGFFTGVVLNPLVGELKDDDVPAVTRMRCYRALHRLQLLGQGDADPAVWEEAGYNLSDVFEVIGLDIKMFYGGPSEAIMHAVYRQNLGFTDLVIGRKHADAPFDDGKPIWGDFDAHHVFDELRGDLQIQPMKIGFAAFYESLGRVDLTDRHPDEKPVTVSGTQVREQLKSGERPNPRIMRPEIADILIEAYHS